MVADVHVTEAIQQSMQGFPPADSVKNGGWGWGWYYNGGARDLIAAYGTYKCDFELRQFYRRVYNTLVQGTVTGVAKKLASTPFEIKASKSNRPLANRFTEMLQSGQFGMGWTELVKMTVLDFATLNRGATWEIIAPGDPTKPIEYADVLGFAIKDGLRCTPTGHPEYPVVYRSRWIPEKRDYTYTALHSSRCIRFVDMPDTDEDLFGVGMCALYRVVGTAYVQILMQRYQVEKLSDLPPEGFITVKGMHDTQVQEAMASYEFQRQQEGQGVFRGLVRLAGFDADFPPEVNITPFAAAPENFNYREYMDMHVNLLAVAFGIDKQEIWELASTNIGSGTQSQVLHNKSQGKFYGDMMTMLERAINRVLPPSLTFEFKWKDPQQDKEIAERAQFWMNIVTTGANVFSREQQMKLLANNVEQFADVLLNDEGELELGDELTPAQTAPQPADIATPEAAVSTPVDTEIRDEVVMDDTSKEIARKDWNGTLDSFVRDFKDAIAAGNDGDVTRRRFGTLARALLQRYGSQAYKDGLAAGGVEVDALDSEDLAAVARWLGEQSGYVTDFANSVYENKMASTGVDSHARMWGNKSLRDIYHQGIAAADKNGVFVWELGNAEHCSTCLRMNGQRHRYNAWKESGYLPGASTLECGGFNCACRLRRSRGRARGTF